VSWIIQTTLRNREIIREKHDIDSDEFNDLIVIEKKIEELYREGFLSDMDIFIINGISDGSNITELTDSLGKSRIVIGRTFVQICDRVAYFIGGYFTDEGYLNHMREDYKLSEDDLDKLRTYMGGRFKHKLMRTK
jgi:hypothetical protein